MTITLFAIVSEAVIPVPVGAVVLLFDLAALTVTMVTPSGPSKGLQFSGWWFTMKTPSPGRRTSQLEPRRCGLWRGGAGHKL